MKKCHSHSVGFIRCRLVRIFLLLAISAAVSVLPAYAKDMVMVSPRSPDSMEGKWFKLIYSEAFSRLNWNLIYEHYPSRRCAFLSNSGMVDGEMERVVTFNDAYPNLVRVEERLQTLVLAVYSTDPALEMNGWESLDNKSLSVGYRRGVKLAEEKLPDFVNPELLDDVSDEEQGIKKLQAGFIDIFIDFESVMNPVLKSDPVTASSIRRIGILEKIPTHPFLNIKHKAHTPALAKVLRSMKHEGLFDLYWDRARNTP